MASPAAQAKANALNAKLEAEARTAIDEIERLFLRNIARKAAVCCTTCYDKAGTTGSSDSLEHCVLQCQAPSQQANAYVQNASFDFLNVH
jgi:hypothetical protein